MENNTKQKKKTEAIQYVDITLKNSRYRRIHTYIKGPKAKRFSYGLPFNPKQRRTERYPVGTKIFQVSILGKRKLLTTIQAEDEGNTVDLFRED